jgi:hypothetical protein
LAGLPFAIAAQIGKAGQGGMGPEPVSYDTGADRAAFMTLLRMVLPCLACSLATKSSSATLTLPTPPKREPVDVTT